MIFSGKKKSAPLKRPVAAQTQTVENLPSSPDAIPSDKNTMQQPAKKKQPNRTRNIQHKVTMSSAEYAVYQRKLETSGLTAQEYLWRAALGKPLKIVDPGLLDAIAALYLELDSYAESLREIMAHNTIYRERDPEGWAKLLEAIQRAEEDKQKCAEALEEAPDEYRQARRKS